MRIKSNKKWIISLISSLVIFVVLVWKIDINTSLSVLFGANKSLLLVACCISLLQNLILGSLLLYKVLRWIDVDISYLECLFMKTACYPIKAILPLKTGEFGKSIYLKRKHGLDTERSVGSVLLTTTLIAAALTIFLVQGAVLSSLELKIYYLLFLLPLLAIFLLKFDRVQDLFLKMNFLRSKFERIFEALKRISFKELFYLLVFSVLVVSISLFNYFIIFLSLGLKLPLGAIFTFVPILHFLTNMPSISGLGYRESLTIILFSAYASKEVLFASGLLFSTIDYILPAIVGLPLLNKFLREMV